MTIQMDFSRKLQAVGAGTFLIWTSKEEIVSIEHFFQFPDR
jgi:hypothetical protein